ncbi:MULTISPECIES: hypothetical protein [unclassified Microbacterium]|uniref:hypothetical protein n=1 Tax=unclassified Microbacterium TaxID=2609290 RepID=UPI0030162D15
MHKPLTDDELQALLTEQGVRAVYQAGWDFAIDRVREDRDRNREFIESMHKVIRSMGFGPLGLSIEQEILSALTSIEQDRQRRSRD